MSRALLKRVLSAMDKGYMGRNHAEYVATMQAVQDELDKAEPEPYGYVSEHNCQGPHQYQFHFAVKTIYPDNCKAITPVYMKEEAA